MATNADFNALIVRITTATNTLEQDVAIITEGTENVSESVAAAQLAASQAQASQAGAASSASTATTQANAAAGSATTATNEANRAQGIADNLLASAPFQEAPKDGNVYGRKDGGWSVVTGGGGGGGAVDSVNGQTGTVVLTAADVGAKPSSYVPTWSEVTGKPATFAPTIGTTADTALAGNTVIPTNTNQLTNGAGFVTSATAPVRSVAGKTGAVTLAGEDLVTGVVAPARLGTGTPNANTVLKGDGTWGSVPPATGGYPLAETAVQYNGSYITQWPLANPNDAAQLSLFGAYVEGDFVEGAALLASQEGLNVLPCGNYWFPAGAFAGAPLSTQAGVLKVERLNATNKRALIHGFTSPTNIYMWTISGSTVTWQSLSSPSPNYSWTGAQENGIGTNIVSKVNSTTTLNAIIAYMAQYGVTYGGAGVINLQANAANPGGNISGSAVVEIIPRLNANGTISEVRVIVEYQSGANIGKKYFANKYSDAAATWSVLDATA